MKLIASMTIILHFLVWALSHFLLIKKTPKLFNNNSTIITKAHLFYLFIDNIVFWEYINSLLSIQFIVVDSSHLQLLTTCQ